MNKFVKAIQSLDHDKIEELLLKDPKWLQWSEKDGKNGLHYVCSVKTADAQKIKASDCMALTNLFIVQHRHHLTGMFNCGSR